MTPDHPIVLHIVDRLTGGVPFAVRNYIENSPDSFSHAILAPFEHGVPSAVWASLPVTHFDLGVSRSRQISRIRKTIAAVRPSAIHAHSSFPGALSRVAHNGKVPIIYSPHCFKFDDPFISRPLRYVYRNAERVLGRRTSTFAVLSEHEELLARSLSQKARIVRIPNVPSFIPLVGPISPPPVNRIGMVGRLSPQKDPDFMISLVKHLSQEIETSESVWIGDGDPVLRSRLSQSATRITGWLTQDQVNEELDKLTLYVHTAAYEGFPLSVLDAAARRLPIIARRIPSLEEAGIQTFDTPEEGATLAARALSDERFRAELRRAGDLLLTRMNPTTQKSALGRAWNAFSSR